MQLVVLLFITSTSRKAKQSTTGRSGIRLVEFTRDAFPPVLLKSLEVLLCQFLSGVTNVGEKLRKEV